MTESNNEKNGCGSPFIREYHFFANNTSRMLARINLNAYEVRTLFALMNLTLSWQKFFKKVTLGELSSVSGLPRSHLSRALKGLQRKGTVFGENHRGRANLMGLNPILYWKSLRPELMEEIIKIVNQLLPEMARAFPEIFDDLCNRLSISISDLGEISRETFTEVGNSLITVTWTGNSYETNCYRSRQQSVTQLGNSTVTQLGNSLAPQAIANQESTDSLKNNIKDIFKEKGYIYILKGIFNFWNTQKIITHKDFEKFRPCISRILELECNGHSGLKNIPQDILQDGARKICEAIQNYASILKDDQYFWTYRWTLKEFLQRGIDKFRSENDPFTNFRKKPDKNQSFFKKRGYEAIMTGDEPDPDEIRMVDD